MEAVGSERKPPMQPTLRRLGAGLLAVCAFGALSAPALAAAPTACDGRALSQPFAPWLDYAWYVQAPGGDFENGLDGWAVSGGAKAVAGNEPWRVAGAGDSRSVSLPSGASVTSPSFCAGLAYPMVRLFSKGGSLLSRLKVEAVYTDASGLLRSTALGLVLPSSTWQPSLPVLTLSGLPILTGTELAIRITAAGGTFEVDDVFVDPYSRH
jgi:hypothetical protein